MGLYRDVLYALGRSDTLSLWTLLEPKLLTAFENGMEIEREKGHELRLMNENKNP